MIVVSHISKFLFCIRNRGKSVRTYKCILRIFPLNSFCLSLCIYTFLVCAYTYFGTFVICLVLCKCGLPWITSILYIYLIRVSLRKHAYSTILKILPPKNENFQIKNSDIFNISAQNIDCEYSLEPPRRCGSNGYPQSMFWAEIWKIIYTPVNPSFTI